MIFNMKEKPERIGEICVQDSNKYLGIVIKEGNKCSKVQQENIIGKARKMANMIIKLQQKKTVQNY